MSRGDDDMDTKLQQLKEARQVEKDAKRTSEKIRDEILDEIHELGQYYFIDADGTKRRAFYSESDSTVVDLDELEACLEEDLISRTVYEEVAPRKADLGALQTAAASGRIPQAVLARTTTIVPGGRSKTVKFGDPTDGD